MSFSLKVSLISQKVFQSLLMSTLPSVYYQFGDQVVNRTSVPDQYRSWDVQWPEYSPTRFSVDFTGKEWADPDIGHFEPKWNQLDDRVDRRSHGRQYQVIDGYPINPCGRTGIALRGCLGRWGPNQAADPIVTRWQRDSDGHVVVDKNTCKPLLQFVAIQRSDTKEWAIPGGMVDPGEEVSRTLKREFFEEALASSSAAELTRKMEILFGSGTRVYSGHVEDPRNTDNAWMETVAVSFHDPTGDLTRDLVLNAGDDAIGVKWLTIDRKLNLFSNHLYFIELIVNKLFSHF